MLSMTYLSTVFISQHRAAAGEGAVLEWSCRPGAK